MQGKLDYTFSRPFSPSFSSHCYESFFFFFGSCYIFRHFSSQMSFYFLFFYFYCFPFYYSSLLFLLKNVSDSLLRMFINAPQHWHFETDFAFPPLYRPFHTTQYKHPEFYQHHHVKAELDKINGVSIQVTRWIGDSLKLPLLGSGHSLHVYFSWSSCTFTLWFKCLYFTYIPMLRG